MRPRLALVTFSVSLVALAAASSAHASFPGANGKIAFEKTPGGYGYHDLFAMNPDGSAVTTLTTDPAIEQSVSWSPDGQKIAFMSLADGDGEVYVMSGDGTGVTQLTHNTGPDGEPTWSPDGQRIAFKNGTGIAAMNPDGSGVTQLTAPEGPCSAEDYDPDWSPSGDKIAFYREVCLGEDDFDVGLWLMNADGSGQVKIRNGAARPSWSPDGEKIAYKSVGGGGPASGINIINADGSGATPLTSSGNSPAWSPDGQKIAFSAGDIYVINVDGTGQAALTSTSESESAPNWQSLPTALQSATSITSALIPVYTPCGGGGNPVDASHGPPALGGSPSDGSCAPAVLRGTARMGPLASGTAAITAIPGDLTTTANEADDRFQVDLSDVRTAGGADYNPNGAGADMTMVELLRITDNYNCAPSPCSGPYNTRATVTDLDFSVPVNCVNTASNGVGASCSVDTTANALIPNAIKEGKQGVVSVFRIRLVDSGPNGVLGTSDDRLFAQGGIFNP